MAKITREDRFVIKTLRT